MRMLFAKAMDDSVAESTVKSDDNRFDPDPYRTGPVMILNVTDVPKAAPSTRKTVFVEGNLVPGINPTAGLLITHV